MKQNSNRSRTLNLLIIVGLIILISTDLIGQTLENSEIRFLGVEAFSTDELTDLLHSEEDDEFDARLVKLDKILLTNFYGKNGYLTVAVFDSLIINRETQLVKIIYEIIEGQRYYLERIEIKGNETYSDNALLKTFEGLTPGEPFDEGMIKNTRQGLENIVLVSCFLRCQIIYLTFLILAVSSLLPKLKRGMISL